MTYKIINEHCVENTVTGVCFPLSNGNADYEEYKHWLALGNTPQEADAPTTPRITKVTMRQARLALLNAGLLDTVNTSIAAMAGAQGTAARIEWEYSQEVQRDKGLVLALGTQLGLSSEQLDDLFTLANTL